MTVLYQEPLPAVYNEMDDEALAKRISLRKQELGDRLLILGHHYQQDDVIGFADRTGDSLKLAQFAADSKADYIVFCGVHFMAETADILTGDDQVVILPDLSAGCSMADMADEDQAYECWQRLASVTDERITPVTYVNSSAAIKAFVGEHDGAVCTSGNCAQVLRWALDRGDKVLFLPDQHLGRNTAYAMGYPLESMVVYDPAEPDGGLSDSEIAGATCILWKGHCSVHQLFRPEHVDQVRQQYPDVQVIVHPECTWEVVQAADQSGSTERIIATIDAADDGTTWAVGTEIHLVARLAERFAPGKQVMNLAGLQCLCTTMYRIDLRHLAYVLDELSAGRVVNRITVDDATARASMVALERMLELTSVTPPA